MDNIWSLMWDAIADNYKDILWFDTSDQLDSNLERDLHTHLRTVIEQTVRETLWRPLRRQLLGRTDG